MSDAHTKMKHDLPRCPRTGGPLTNRRNLVGCRWLLPFMGFISLIWFLIRVIPKPSRAAYPCQRVAAPLASGFVLWLIGLAGAGIAFRKAREHLRRSAYAVAAACLLLGLVAVWFTLSTMPGHSASADVAASFVPSDLPNTPMGVARGIFPGRVVWIHDPDATNWDGSTGYYWEDSHTSQTVVDSMMSRSVQWLSGQMTDGAAWDALFRYFNQNHSKGDTGYVAGEKIAVKVNINNCSDYTSLTNNCNTSPQAIRVLLRQLVNAAHVPESAITVYDATRFFGDFVYTGCHTEFPGVQFVDQAGQNGRIAAQRDTNWRIHFAAEPLLTEDNRTGSATYLPTCAVQADYIINLAALKGHGLAGVTLCAKNHYGSIMCDDYSGNPAPWPPQYSGLHRYCACVSYLGMPVRQMGTYNGLVDLMGHQHLGGKTMLFIVDGLYGASTQNATPTKWTIAPFNNDWPSSLLVSQDGVAIDSVGLDLLSAQGYAQGVNCDNYLHEAALANNPPSGTVYDPEGDGTRLAGLGAHEHWNSPNEMLYSRNLGTGNGIELIAPERGFQIGLAQGWNLISMPISPLGNARDAVFPSAIASAVWEYANPGGYTVPANVEPKKGYWVKAAQAATLPIEGARPGVKAVQLKAGWDLVGVVGPSGGQPSRSVPAVSAVWQYNAPGGYQIPAVCSDGHGFWMKAAADTSIWATP